MVINKILNSTEQGKTTIPNNEIEDIFEHESDTSPDTPERISVQPAPEIRPDSQVEKEVNPETIEAQNIEATGEDEISQRRPAPSQDSSQTSTIPSQKPMELVKIENILAENLDELFLTMTPQQQMDFKQKGEETAIKINKLLQETKIKIKEIVTLIKEWLKIIPGINKFFLEQEAKIKTDRLLNIREQKK